jgi:hypothetical protein
VPAGGFPDSGPPQAGPLRCSATGSGRGFGPGLGTRLWDQRRGGSFEYWNWDAADVSTL